MCKIRLVMIISGILFIAFIASVNYAIARLLASQPVRKFSNGVKIIYLFLFLFMFFLTGQGGCGGGKSTSGSSVVIGSPTVTTKPASDVGDHVATLNGTVNSNGLSNIVCFRWGRSSVLANSYITESQTYGGTTGLDFFKNLTNLSGNVKYYFKAVAQNSAGTAYGATLDFNTTGINNPPIMDTISDRIVNEGQLLNFTIPASDPDEDILIYSITSKPQGATLNSGTGEFSWTPDYTRAGNYNVTFRVTDIGDLFDEKAITITVQNVLKPPICTTLDADNIMSNTARLNSTVNPNGFLTSCDFEWSLTSLYGNTYPSTPQTIGSGEIGMPFSVNLPTTLIPDTDYNFRVRATNIDGTVYGDNLTFRTLKSPPVCTTTAATNIGSGSAILNGTVNPNGQNVTYCYFDYGIYPNYGTMINVTALPGNGTIDVPVSATISSGLSSAKAYQFRIVAITVGGTGTNSEQIFITEDSWDKTNTDDDTSSTTNSLYLSISNSISNTQYSQGPHSLNSVDNYDWYKIYLSSSYKYTFYTNTIYPASSPYPGTVCELCNAGYTVVASNNPGAGLDFNITAYKPSSSGNYYLRVRTNTVGNNWIGYLYYQYTQ